MDEKKKLIPFVGLMLKNYVLGFCSIELLFNVTLKGLCSIVCGDAE